MVRKCHTCCRSVAWLWPLAWSWCHRRVPYLLWVFQPLTSTVSSLQVNSSGSLTRSSYFRLPCMVLIKSFFQWDINFNKDDFLCILWPDDYVRPQVGLDNGMESQFPIQVSFHLPSLDVGSGFPCRWPLPCSDDTQPRCWDVCLFPNTDCLLTRFINDRSVSYTDILQSSVHETLLFGRSRSVHVLCDACSNVFAFCDSCTWWCNLAWAISLLNCTLAFPHWMAGHLVKGLMLLWPSSPPPPLSFRLPVCSSPLWVIAQIFIPKWGTAPLPKHFLNLCKYIFE